jgi:hypothetical protein
MSKKLWHKIGSPELVPSVITLRAYADRPTSSTRLCQNVPIELGGKTILIDIEVIDFHLDYNILFGRRYMYAMKEVASSVFHTMMFPHNGKIVTIDQLHITSLTIPPTSITSSPLSTLARMIFQLSTLALDYSKTHPCWELIRGCHHS